MGIDIQNRRCKAIYKCSLFFMQLFFLMYIINNSYLGFKWGLNTFIKRLNVFFRKVL